MGLGIRVALISQSSEVKRFNKVHSVRITGRWSNRAYLVNGGSTVQQIKYALRGRGGRDLGDGMDVVLDLFAGALAAATGEEI